MNNDLNNLFRHHSHTKHTPPKMRLFRESPPQEERSQPPHKSILKMSRKTSAEDQRLPEGLGELSRELSGSGMGKERTHYNRAVCLVLFRKLFFLMAGVFGVSVGTGLWDQQRVLAHIILVISRTHCPFAFQWLDTFTFKTSARVLTSLVYFANFKLLFLALYPSPRPIPPLAVDILAAQAVVGMWVY